MLGSEALDLEAVTLSHGTEPIRAGDDADDGEDQVHGGEACAYGRGGRLSALTPSKPRTICLAMVWVSEQRQAIVAKNAPPLWFAPAKLGWFHMVEKISWSSGV